MRGARGPRSHVSLQRKHAPFAAGAGPLSFSLSLSLLLSPIPAIYRTPSPSLYLARARALSVSIPLSICLSLLLFSPSVCLARSLSPLASLLARSEKREKEGKRERERERASAQRAGPHRIMTCVGWPCGSCSLGLSISHHPAVCSSISHCLSISHHPSCRAVRVAMASLVWHHHMHWLAMRLMLLTSHQQTEVNYLPRLSSRLISLERSMLSIDRAGEIDLL